MNIFKYIKCLLIGHDISDNKSIVDTFCSNHWIRKCNCCGRYIMHGDIGSISISEKEAFKIKNEFDELFNLYSVSVVDDSGSVVATTDFTNEQENLEVWKAAGLQEEDFYKR